jgi:murein tripeptide amidase MpaA
MKIHRPVLVAVALAAAPLGAPWVAASDLLTRAETSGFRATSSYDETLDLLRRLAGRSPFVRLDSFGVSGEGRPLPLVVVSRDKAFTAAEARRLSKPIVLLQSGIHAGEIDGKDASLILLRELATGGRPEILDAITLLLVPIYNVDGHERVSRFNRSNQDGPEEGQGFRTTASGLDLNRDHLKLESAEARALVGLVNAWRPHLHVDNHVSNGFDHAC